MIRRVVAVVVFGIAASLVVGGLSRLVHAGADLGRGVAAGVDVAFAAAGLAVAWIVWAIWPARDRTD
jgi:hypothetical protein